MKLYALTPAGALLDAKAVQAKTIAVLAGLPSGCLTMLPHWSAKA